MALERLAGGVAVAHVALHVLGLGQVREGALTSTFTMGSVSSGPRADREAPADVAGDPVIRWRTPSSYPDRAANDSRGGSLRGCYAFPREYGQLRRGAGSLLVSPDRLKSRSRSADAGPET